MIPMSAFVNCDAAQWDKEDERNVKCELVVLKDIQSKCGYWLGMG
jgi:hypothetical protein